MNVNGKIEDVFVETLNEWDYGYSVFEDGNKIPWLRLNDTHQKRFVWKNNKWVPGTKFSADEIEVKIRL